MGRIVVNKHFDDKSLITSEKFVNKGEIVISNQVGYEGIFITNKKGEVFYIGPTTGTGSDVPVDFKDYVNTAVDSIVDSKIETQLENYFTEGEVNALLDILSGSVNTVSTELANFSAFTVTKLTQLSAHTLSEVTRIDEDIAALRSDFEDVAAGIVDEEYIKQVVNSAITKSLESLEGDITETVNEVKSGMTALQEIVSGNTQAINDANDSINLLSGTTESGFTDVNALVNALRDDLTELSAYTENIQTGSTENPDTPVVGGLTEDEVKDICAAEIAKVVSGAPSTFDTLKEIADWIGSDTTNATTMANDIEKLKAQLNAITLGVKAAISVSVSNFYKGEETEVTVTGKISPSTLENYTVNLYKGAVDGILLSSSTDSSCVYTETITGDTTYGVKVIYNSTPYTAVTKVSSYHPIYYGFGKNYGTIVTDGIKAPAKSSAKGNYKGTSETDGVYYFILVPNGVTKPTSFTMGGAPFNMESTEELINNVIYTVFKSGSIFNNGGSVDITAA